VSAEPGEEALSAPTISEVRTARGVEALLWRWEHRTRINLKSHNAAANHYENLDKLSGALVFGATVAAATAITVVPVDELWFRITFGALAAIAGVVSGLQSYLHFGPLAVEHRYAARLFAVLRREVEIALDGPRPSQDQLEDIVKWWNFAAASAPNVPHKLRARVIRDTKPRAGEWENQAADLF
jgi:hypothetical protein